MSHRGGGGASRGGGGGGMMAARSVGAARSQGSFRGRGMRGPVGSFPHTFVSTCGAGGCGNEFGFRRRYFDNFVAYPYPYPSYSYTTVPYPIVPLVTNYSVGNSPTYFGSCQAVDGVGVVQNNCWGLVPVPQAGNQCVCYDRTTGVSGCMNVAGAACAPVVPSPYL